MKREFILPSGERRANRSTCRGFIDLLPIGKPWRVTIEPYRKQRSHEQNAYLWGVVYRKIMDHLEGWDANDVHEYYLGECFGWTVLTGLGKRKRVKPLRRSSKLNKQEFTDYIDFVRRKAAEIGIDIPDATEET